MTINKKGIMASLRKLPVNFDEKSSFGWLFWGAPNEIAGFACSPPPIGCAPKLNGLTDEAWVFASVFNPNEKPPAVLVGAGADAALTSSAVAPGLIDLQHAHFRSSLLFWA